MNTSGRHSRTPILSRINHFILLPFFSFLLLCTFSSCSDSVSPGDELRTLFSTVETHFEKGEGRKIKSYVAEQYRDKNKRNKKDIEGIITYYLLQHKKIHLLHQVTDISFTDPHNCTATLYVAMAGREAELKKLAESLQLDVYEFTFNLQKTDKTWKLIEASWQPGSIDNIAPLLKSLHNHSTTEEG